MELSQNPPFRIGEYMAAPSATDIQRFCGRRYVFPDLDYSSNPPKPRAYYQDGMCPYKTVQVVRNLSTIALTPKLLATFKSGYRGFAVDGYLATLAGEGWAIDEFVLGTIPINALFYVTVDGFGTCLSALEADATNVITANAYAVGLASAATTNTTAGRVGSASLGGATSPLSNAIINRLGMALSTKTTGNTNADVLVHFQPKF